MLLIIQPSAKSSWSSAAWWGMEHSAWSSYTMRIWREHPITDSSSTVLCLSCMPGMAATLMEYTGSRTVKRDSYSKIWLRIVPVQNVWSKFGKLEPWFKTQGLNHSLGQNLNFKNLNHTLSYTIAFWCSQVHVHQNKNPSVGATVHCTDVNMQYLDNNFGDRVISRRCLRGREWPPRSPDLSPLDFCPEL